MDHPVIGITTYAATEHPAPSTHYDSHYAAPTQYVHAVARAGGVPVLLPPHTPSWERWLDAVDGVVISGGADVEPSHYGQAAGPDTQQPHPARDTTELGLAASIVERHMPALFVCRGVQVLNVALGGTLHQHIPSLDIGDIHRDGQGQWAYHGVDVKPDSRVVTALGEHSAPSCSGHHQALDRVADRLAVTARAPDGLVEAVELEGAAWIVGVQWHPEVTAERDPSQQALFDELVRAAQRS